MRAHDRDRRHTNPERAYDLQTLFEDIFQFRIIFCAVMIPDDRRAPHRIAEKYANENKSDILDYAVRGNALIPNELHKLCVIQNTDRGKRDIRDQFGKSVDAYPNEYFSVKARFAKTEQTVVFAGKI